MDTDDLVVVGHELTTSSEYTFQENAQPNSVDQEFKPPSVPPFAIGSKRIYNNSSKNIALDQVEVDPYLHEHDRKMKIPKKGNDGVPAAILQQESPTISQNSSMPSRIGDAVPANMVPNLKLPYRVNETPLEIHSHHPSSFCSVSFNEFLRFPLLRRPTSLFLLLVIRSSSCAPTRTVCSFEQLPPYKKPFQPSEASPSITCPPVCVERLKQGSILMIRLAATSAAATAANSALRSYFISSRRAGFKSGCVSARELRRRISLRDQPYSSYRTFQTQRTCNTTLSASSGSRRIQVAITASQH
jgi:hypothetical protein